MKLNDHSSDEGITDEGVNEGITDDVLMELIKHKGNWITYDDLYKEYKNGKTLEQLMKDGVLVVLYMSADDYGHWCCVIDHRYDPDPKNVIEFFDSYGKYKDKKGSYYAEPDNEFNWIPQHLKKKYHQQYPTLSKMILDHSLKYDEQIEFNEYPFQKDDGETATCGRWVALRIRNKDMPLVKFQKLIDKLSKDVDKDEFVYHITTEYE